MDRPSGLPMVLILESRSHLDIGDLTNLLAAELGVMTVRLERAIRSLDGVARVHVNRWGDGTAHLHLWFLARPIGQLQLRGSFLSLWDDILDPIPESMWRENLAHVAAWLADFGGRAIAEPPRIEWHAPSSFGEVASAEALVLDVPAGDGPEAGTVAAGQNGVAAGAIETQNGAVPGTGETQNGAAPAGTAAGVETRTGTIAETQNGAAGVPSTAGTTSAPATRQPEAGGEPAAEASNGAAERRPKVDGPDGLGGEGWMLSAEDVEESDILTR